MNYDRRDQILSCFWSHRDVLRSSDIYAVLDGARDPRILPMLKRSSLDYRCLYAGRLSRRLAAAAPYLVIIPQNRDSRFTTELFEQGWGGSWGIFLESEATLLDLRRHFRKFLRVQDPSGRKLIFRFYDPRVFRVYLPTCNAEELQFIFGPVTRYFAEGDVANAITEYRRAGHSLEQRVVNLKGVSITEWRGRR